MGSIDEIDEARRRNSIKIAWTEYWGAWKAAYEEQHGALDGIEYSRVHTRHYNQWHRDNDPEYRAKMRAWKADIRERNKHLPERRAQKARLRRNDHIRAALKKEQFAIADGMEDEVLRQINALLPADRLDHGDIRRAVRLWLKNEFPSE